MQEAAQHLRNAVYTLGQAFPEGNIDLVLALQDLANCLRMSMVEDAAQVTQRALIEPEFSLTTSALVRLSACAAGFSQLASAVYRGGQPSCYTNAQLNWPFNTVCRTRP